MQAGTLLGNITSAIGISTEEATLIADLKAGSEEAFGILIAQYHQPLFSLIARNLDDPSEASDITQEVFIKVFRSIRSFHGGSSLRTWLYRIALRESSNQRRWWSRHKRREVSVDAPMSSQVEDEGPTLASLLADSHRSPLEYAEQAELRSLLETALREVPENFRTVLILREIDGFSYDEIAEIVGANLGTVKSRLTRGRQMMRTLLKGKLATSAVAEPSDTRRTA